MIPCPSCGGPMSRPALPTCQEQDRHRREPLDLDIRVSLRIHDDTVKGMCDQLLTEADHMIGAVNAGSAEEPWRDLRIAGEIILFCGELRRAIQR